MPDFSESWDLTAFEFSPDSRSLDIGYCFERVSEFCSDNRITAWSLERNKYIFDVYLGDNNDTFDLTFDQNGHMLASTIADSYIYLWDQKTGASLGQPLVGRTHQISFSPDGSLLASADGDGNIFIWDVGSRQLIGQILEPTDALNITSMYFTDDGKKLVLGGCQRSVDYDCEQGEIILLDVDLEVWVNYACKVAGRNLTYSEWLQFLPSDEDYRKTCDQWPLESDVLETSSTP